MALIDLSGVANKFCCKDGKHTLPKERKIELMKATKKKKKFSLSFPMFKKERTSHLTTEQLRNIKPSPSPCLQKPRCSLRWKTQVERSQTPTLAKPSVIVASVHQPHAPVSSKPSYFVTLSAEKRKHSSPRKKAYPFMASSKTNASPMQK